MLDVAVKGHSTESLGQARQVLGGRIQDADFAHLRELQSPVGDYKSDRKTGDCDSIQCAAKLVSDSLCLSRCQVLFPVSDMKYHV